MNKQSFIKGTMILLIAGIINRILGFIPRIALPRIIGAEGVGLYQLGYPFFLVLVTIITGGIPLAIAKLVAEAEAAGQRNRSRAILRVSLTFSILLSIIFMLLSLIFAPWVTHHILTDSRVYYTFLSMSPMIVIVAISSVYRGYFQGLQNMIPSASSSIIETLVRILCVLWFSYLMLPLGIPYGAAGAMLGVVAGELIGLAVILWYYRGHLKREKESFPIKPSIPLLQIRSPHMLRTILGISIPVTASRLVGSLSYLLESITTAQSLALAGIATGMATAQYGALQGMIIPILLLPGALTTSLATSLVPSLSEAAARKDNKTIHKRLHQSIRLALVTGAPFVVLMYVLAEPLCVLLYDNTEIAPMLKIMAPFGLFLYIQAPLQATLQALNKAGKALLNTFIGAVIKIILILQLASQPEYGIYGAIIAICINIVIVTLMHSYSVARLVKFHIKLIDLLKVSTGMIIMAAFSHFFFYHFKMDLPWLQLTSSFIAGLIIYLTLMAVMKLIDLHDLERVPLIGPWFKAR
ncbi:stage V sporulation protein B [Paenibacillus sediminis]|uniref:Stage V sporulation protein B n=1 Tax=Paenibacillus sediminis TaxID=664909 RepID=A0ABS4GZ36_9BACL|nr:stage V sporulation protein B [Paenibacillus sediminis]MBP1935155.1 stage V sporulation protein B [Paenibacillus sediminis]